VNEKYWEEIEVRKDLKVEKSSWTNKTKRKNSKINRGKVRKVKMNKINYARN
jgi:hypothetical protein